MKRQKIRKAIGILSFLLFPIIIYYFSPYLILLGATAGIITGSFIVFATLFFVSLFLGRGFCGYVCPTGGLQECLILASDKKAKGGKFNWIKYFIWAPWMGAIIIMFVKAGGFLQVDFLFMTVNGISVIEPMAYIIYYGVLLLIVILSLTAGKRGFCHYVCWIAPFMIIGTKVSQALSIPRLHLKSDQDKCIHCNRCTQKCPMSLDVLDLVQKNQMYNSECILCGECVDVCPKAVIKYAFKK